MTRLGCWVAGAVMSAVLASPAVAGQRAGAPPVTFAADIAPILVSRCGSCHRPRGAAPFSLLTYADVRQRARLVAAVTQARLMPPWKSEPGAGDFIGHDHLSDAEIDRIQRWVAEGAPEGDLSALPRMPAWTDGWQLGTPDLTVSLPAPFVVPADGLDFSRIFVLPLPVTDRTYVKGFEFKPGNGGVVHHANIRIDASPRSRELDAQDAEPGYVGLLMPTAVYPDGHFLGWTPGQVAPLLPPGLAWRLNPGTDLVVEMHFVPNGRMQAVQPEIALYFTADAPVRTPAMLRLGRQNIEIPAGAADYVTSDSFVLPVDVDVQAVQPHAHYRARDVRGTATLPDGSSIPLIGIRDWDYRWQHVYRYVRPPRLPKGTTITLRYVFDNSAANPRNPQQPPQPVHWGQRSTDEMGDLWVQLLPRRAEDLPALVHALTDKHAREEIVGYEMMIRSEPDKISLRNDVAVLYAAAGEPGKAAEHLAAVVRLQPEVPAAHYNLGTALSAAGQLTAAIERFERALALRPDYAPAHNNLGGVLLSLGRTGEARQHLSEAVRLDPKNASAHANLAWILATSGSAAVRDVERALSLAERAATLTGHRDAAVLDVLAAAQAAAGQFDRAIATCRDALARLPDGAAAAAVRERLALYTQRRAYVSP